MKFSNYKSSRNFAKELEEELEDSEEDSIKPAEEVQKNLDVEGEVNITECTKSTDNKSGPPEYQHLTESEGSSSFDECGSDFGNDDDDRLFWAGFEASFAEFAGLSGKSRKKVTAHWRSFIQPIMWRCKWAESQMEKLQSIAQQYDRELEALKRQKQIQSVDSTLIDGVKSLPFSRTNDKSDFMRRKKRRMIEATTDVAAYMSRHNLFSYYENEENPTEDARESDLPKGTGDEFWTNEDLSSFFTGDCNSSLLNILQKIELLQSRACQLMNRVRVIRENAENRVRVTSENAEESLDNHWE